MAQMDLPIEFKTDHTDADLNLYVQIEDRLNELAKGHSDITGAAATIEKPAEGRSTSYAYTASIVVYTRPKNIAATEQHEDPKMALKGALDAVERQVRKKREKLNDHKNASTDDLWLDEDIETDA